MKPTLITLPVLMMVALMMPCVWAGSAVSPDDLFQAASRGDQRTIERVNKAGVGINAHDAQGWSAVHHAAASGQTRLLPVLYRKGLSLN
jgi:ankyrin repeat protein